MFKKIIKNSISAIRWPLLPNGIYCFNYHRVGNQENNNFDPNIYSCTAEMFEKHLIFLKKEFKVISVDDMIIMKEKGFPIDSKYAVITFDDGYIDNYLEAYPLLKKHGLTAAFYIATDYVNSNSIPWWDRIGWIIRNRKNDIIRLDGWKESIDLSKFNLHDAHRAVLRLIKNDNGKSIDDKVKELENACQSHLINNPDKSSLFVNWDQIIEMSKNDMHIGSHTLSHQMLSHLKKDDQLFEVTESKKIIEEKIEKEVTTIAYPVGGYDSFNENTIELTKEAGYKLGFSFIPGIIQDLNNDDSFKIKRFSVDNNPTQKDLKNTVIFNISSN